MENKLQRESELLTALVASALTGKTVKQEAFESVNVKSLYKLSKYHELHNLTGYAIKQNGIELADEHAALFDNAKEICMYRIASQITSCELVKQKLCENKVHFVLLKGSVIRALYPSEDLRTSGDIDILYNVKDISENGLEAIMNELGFEKTKGSKTVDTFSNGNCVYEMHRKLCPDKDLRFMPESMTKLFDGKLSDTEYEMSLSNEEFYVYHISHIAKHFCSHGCGIRPLADMYLILEKYGESLDKGVLSKLFKETGLVRFEENTRALVNSIFKGTEMNSVQQRMFDVMMFSGIYGNVKRSAANERMRNQGVKGGNIKRLTKMAFLPFANMKAKYPVLKKAPVLLPVMWCVRLFDVLLHKSDRVKNSVNSYNNVDTSEIDKTVELHKELGL